MNKKLKMILMLNLVTFVLLFSSVINSQAATRDWNPGDIFLFGYGYSDIYTYIDHSTGFSQVYESSMATEVQFNITGIDTVTKYYDVTQKSAGFTGYYSIDYSWDDWCNDELETQDIFDIDYDYDYFNNRTVLFYENIFIGVRYLIEPDWVNINKFFKDSINASYVLDTVADPWDPIIHNFTLSDFLNSLDSFKIMNKGTINRALNQFNDDTTKWSIEFDMSNILHTRTWNVTAGTYNYYPYSEYIISLEMEYSEGGVIKEARYAYSFKQQIDDYENQYYYEENIAIGGIDKVMANFALIAVIPAIASVAIGIKIIKKRRK